MLNVPRANDPVCMAPCAGPRHDHITVIEPQRCGSLYSLTLARTSAANNLRTKSYQSIVKKPIQNTGSTRLWVISILLFLSAIALYSPAIDYGYVNWDDDQYILENHYLDDLSWEGLKGIFTSNVVANFHPVTILSYAVEHAFFGKDPAIMHGTNIVLHAANAVLVLFLLFRLTGNVWRAAIVASIFVVHPMHVESVVWISERKDVLYSFFVLSALLTYLAYLRSGKIKFYWSCFALFVIALLSKPAAAAMAPLLFVIDYHQQRSFSRKVILEKLPFFLAALSIGVIALSTQSGAMDASFAPHFPLWQRPMIAAYGVLFYLKNYFVPSQLSAFHAYPLAPGEGLAPYLAAAGVLILVIALVIFLVRRHPRYTRTVITGFGFFLVMLGMVLQLLPVGRTIVAERFAYMPYIGLSLIASDLLVQLWNAVRPGNLRWAIAVGCAVVLSTFAYITRDRIAVWKDSITLFTDVLEKYPTEAGIRYNRGLTYYNEGSYQLAIADFTESIRHDPGRGASYFNRGMAFKELGDMEAVVKDMSLALEFGSSPGEALQNRGIAYASMNDLDRGLQDLEAALVHLPNDTAILVNLGIGKQLTGYPDKACALWAQAKEANSITAKRLLLDHCK